MGPLVSCAQLTGALGFGVFPVGLFLRIIDVQQGMNRFVVKKWPRVFFVCFLGGGFKYFLFSPLLGEDSQFD